MIKYQPSTLLISKLSVSPSPLHHICGAEGNDPAGWLPRHFLSNALSLPISLSLCLLPSLPYHPSSFSFGIHFSSLPVEIKQPCYVRESVPWTLCSRRSQRLAVVLQTSLLLLQSIQNRQKCERGCACGHYWLCTLPCCLTLYINQFHREEEKGLIEPVGCKTYHINSL